MKIQIDLTAKTIKLESNVNFGEFIEKMQQMLPDWKEYSISTNTTIQWKEYPVWIYKPYERHNWWYSTAGNTTASLTTAAIGISSSGITFTSNSNPLFESKAPNKILNVEI